MNIKGMVGTERLAKGMYWSRAWTLTRGCAHVTPGCEHCWSERASHMRKNHPNVEIRDQYGLTDENGHWTGKVETLPLNLGTPLRVKKPQVWAVWNDLFHEDIPFSFIEAVWDVMFDCPQHVFMILTKRPKRASQFIEWMRQHHRRGDYPNIWMGVTTENQEQVDKRIPELLKLRSYFPVLFVSVEPCLGQVVLPPDFLALGKQAWVICGSESGPNRRPMKFEWVRSLRDQCDEAKVPMFIKQIDVNGKVNHNISEWPYDLRIRRHPK